jgi:hypothetical protein
MKRFWVFRGVKVLALVAAGLAVFGYLVMSLWNWLLPPLTGWHVISFGQALALLVLCRILFGGFRGRGGGWHWRHRMRERWEQMTPDERERLRDTLGHGCRAPSASSGPSPP